MDNLENMYYFWRYFNEKMNLALYIRHEKLWQDERYLALERALNAYPERFTTYRLGPDAPLREDTDWVLSMGGDGTFLSAATQVGAREIPILGVNLGRIGFLSENTPEDTLEKLLSGAYTIEERSLLKVDVSGVELSSPYALNEVGVLRKGAAMLGVDVCVDGVELPTYWADGLLVATSSGSTAYSLSVGGPIVMPEAKVWILSPIAPHNLNVRPLVIPDGSSISLSFQARENSVSLSLDNRIYELSTNANIKISMAQFSLKRVRLSGSNFFAALTDKLHWGEDLRNNK